MYAKELILYFFIHNYIASNYKYIITIELRYYFLEYYLILTLSTNKFSILIILFINNLNINTFNIKRKRIRIKNIYYEIKLVN